MANWGNKKVKFMAVKQRKRKSMLQSFIIFLRISQSSHLRSDDPHPVLVDEPDGILSWLAVLPECDQ